MKRPSRLQLATAAATIAAAAGVAIGAVSTGSSQATGAGNADAIGRAVTAHATTATHQSHGKQAPVKLSAKSVHHAATRHAAPVKHKAPGKPYEIYDSVNPSAIPAGHAVATYADGGYAVSPSQVAGRRTVLWIDTNGSDPKANALDVEPGDATPQIARAWTYSRLHSDPRLLARIYTMRSEWPAVQAQINTLPASMRSHVRYWIADPTGVPHIVPGSSATQWYWGPNYDISTATPGF
jgi:hypothetical protein